MFFLTTVRSHPNSQALPWSIGQLAAPRATMSLRCRFARRWETKGTVFMHDLPAVRGEDVEAEVIEGPQSIVYNRRVLSSSVQWPSWNGRF